MQRVALVGAVAVAAACASQADAPGPRYLHDAAYRRAALTASLVNADNGYSKLRLAHYATGDTASWDALPEWNPVAEPVLPGDLDVPGGAGTDVGTSARALVIGDDARRGDEAALVALGADAFFRYPAQLLTSAPRALVSRARAEGYGFWIDPRGVGGIVRAKMADGSGAFAITCATCHADVRDGAFVIGLGSAGLDLGRLAFEATGGGAPPGFLAWGPGRVDVTTLDGVEPVRIPDLRPVRWLTHLHQDATVAQRDRDALAIRIETLIVTSHGMTLRPPREVALGLAAYLWSLASSVASRAPVSDAETRGASLFATRCASCHAPPALTGPPVPLDVIGTDPAIGLSPERGTGTYRVPSLHGVAARGSLLHDASLAGPAALDTMFDPSRTTDAFTGGARPGAVRGHAFGLELDAGARADLVAYVRTL